MDLAQLKRGERPGAFAVVAEKNGTPYSMGQPDSFEYRRQADACAERLRYHLGMGWLVTVIDLNEEG